VREVRVSGRDRTTRTTVKGVYTVPVLGKLTVRNQGEGVTGNPYNS